MKVGPLNVEGLYEYVILTQALKHPTLVLVRDRVRFEAPSEQRAEITDYLDRYGYMSPLAALNTPLHFMNSTTCVIANQYFDNVR